MLDFLTALAWLVFLLLVATVYWYASIPKNLPPGPPGLPFLGNALEYGQSDRHHSTLYEHMKKYGPIFRLYMGENLVVILGDYERIHEALVNQGDNFAGRPQTFAFSSEELRNYGIGLTEGPLWKEQRRFALSTLRDFGFGRSILEPHIKLETDYLSATLKSYVGRSFDPQRPLILAVSNILSQMFFGRRYDYEDEEYMNQIVGMSKRSSGGGVGFLSPFILSEKLGMLAGIFPQVRKWRLEGEDFVRFTKRELKETMKTYDPRSEPTNYIHAFMNAAAEGENTPERATFSDKQLLASVVDIFTAGTETSTTTIHWGLLYLATYPEVQERMVLEMRDVVGMELPDYADRTKLPYCEAVITELQRVSNLAPFGVPRRNFEKTKLFGYDIPKDTTVVPFLTNVLHDEKSYPDAQRFKPERFLDAKGKFVHDAKIMPFQIGKRICLGESLARMELFLFLTGLITRFRFYFPSDQTRPTLKPIMGITSAPQPFRICAEPRNE